MRLIPWDVTIPAAERDESLGTKLQAEEPGILRWIVEGCRRYLANGIDAPEEVLARTATFRGDQDTVSRFIADVGIVFEPKERVLGSTLMELHEVWCADAGIAKQSVAGEWKRVVAELKKKGAVAGKGAHGTRHWAGITLVDKAISAGQAVNQPNGVARVAGLPVIPGFTYARRVTGTAATSATRGTESNGHEPLERSDDELERLFASDGD